jgi:hypothetical protein
VWHQRAIGQARRARSGGPLKTNINIGIENPKTKKYKIQTEKIQENVLMVLKKVAKFS